MSNRDLGPGSIAAAQEDPARWLFLVELDFTSGMVRAHNAIGTYNVFGQDFFGVGILGGIEEIKETKEPRPPGLQVSLSGVDPNLLADIQISEQHGRDARVWVAWANDDWQIIEEPDYNRPYFQGLINSATFRISDQEATISVTLDHELIRVTRSSKARATSEHQRGLFPTDSFFDQMAELHNRNVSWGAIRVNVQERGAADRVGGQRRPGGTRIDTP